MLETLQETQARLQLTFTLSKNYAHLTAERLTGLLKINTTVDNLDQAYDELTHAYSRFREARDRLYASSPSYSHCPNCEQL